MTVTERKKINFNVEMNIHVLNEHKRIFKIGKIGISQSEIRSYL